MTLPPGTTAGAKATAKATIDWGKKYLNAAKDTEANTAAIKEIRTELEEIRADLKHLTALVHGVIYQQSLDRNDAQHEREKAEKDREIFELHVRLALAEKGIVLPSPSPSVRQSSPQLPQLPPQSQ